MSRSSLILNALLSFPFDIYSLASDCLIQPIQPERNDHPQFFNSGVLSYRGSSSSYPTASSNDQAIVQVEYRYISTYPHITSQGVIKLGEEQ